MRIEKGSRVTLAYSMKLEDGAEVESVSVEEGFSFVMGRSEVFPAIEAALWHRKEGEAFAFDIRPEDGFGRYDEQLVRPYPKDAFDEGPLQKSSDGPIRAGQRYTAETIVEGVPVSFLVKEVREETVIVDFNHHLAGKALKVRVQILKVG